MKVLITGGAGFIGSHIAEYYGQRPDTDVRIIDNLRTGKRSNIEDLPVEFTEGSITDRSLLKELMQGVDYVFHLAAMVSVPESMMEPEECLRINGSGFLNVLQAASDCGVKKLVYSSTSAIYGNDPTLPKEESHSPCPLSPYAVTKLDGEYYMKIFSRPHGLQTAAMRYFNVFGPRQDPDSAYAAAIPIFVHRALRNEDIIIYGDGQQTRDFVFVKDVVQANVLLTTQGSGVYNVGCGSCITINQIAETVCRITGSRSKIIHAKERPGDVRHSTADIARIRAIGFEPQHALNKSLAQTIEYFMQIQRAELADPTAKEPESIPQTANA